MKLRVAGRYIHVRLNRDEGSLVARGDYTTYNSARILLIDYLRDALDALDHTVIEKMAPAAANAEVVKLGPMPICGATTATSLRCQRSVMVVGHRCYQHKTNR